MPLTSYKVGLVIGKGGINAAQLGYLSHSIKFINSNLEEGAAIQMLVSAMDLKKPGENLPPQLKSLLYKGRVHHQILPAMKTNTRAPEFLYSHLKDCDEVWCCPCDIAYTNGRNRATALYWHARTRPEDDHAARRFKLISPWTQVPVEEAKPHQVAAMKKGKR